jgi:bacterioferritin-associated ferredoxin
MYGLPTHDGTWYRLTALPPYRLPMTSRAGAVRVSACICRATPFAELLPQARANGWDLAALMRETGCGAQCGLCRPYLRRMLRTGETAFHELLTADDS